MKNMSRIIAVVVLMLRAVAAFAQERQVAQPDGFSYVVTGKTVLFAGRPVFGVDYFYFKDLGGGYGIDKYNAFYCGRKIFNASALDFKVLADGYAKNMHDVFFRGKKVKGAKPASFT